MKNILFLFSMLFGILGYTDARERLGFQEVNSSRMDELVNLHYFGAYKLGYGAGQYLNHSFGLSSKPQDPSGQSFVWVNRPGTYNALRGYWIFMPNARQCWQAINTNGPLTMWNKDGKAKGDPEDWELFVYEFADNEHSAVFVKNIYGRYVRYAAPGFVCDSDKGNAAAFYPEF